MASGLHEAVKGPASIPLVIVMCILSGGGGGALGWNRSASVADKQQEQISKQQEEVNALKVDNGRIRQSLDDKNAEIERRFSELTESLKEMKRTLDHVAEKIGAKP